jgi:hypothetical protein
MRSMIRLVLSLFLASQAFGISRIQLAPVSAATSAVNTQTVTFSSTPTVGNTVIVGISADEGGCGTTLVSDNQAGLGNVYVRVNFWQSGCGNSMDEASLWCAPVVAATGTFTITAHAGNPTGSTGSFFTLFAVEYSGLSCNGDQVAAATTLASPYGCGSITTNNASDLLIALLDLNNGSTTTATVSAGYTIQLQQNNPASEIGFYADQIVSSTLTTAPTFTSTATATGNCTVTALKAASGGGGGGTVGYVTQ